VGAFPDVAPRTLTLLLWELRQRREFVAIVEELVQGNFHGVRKLFKRLNGGNGMPVFDARDVAPKQARASFYIALDRPDLLVQVKRECFYITAMGGEDGFTPQGLQAAGAGGPEQMRLKLVGELLGCNFSLDR